MRLLWEIRLKLSDIQLNVNWLKFNILKKSEKVSSLTRRSLRKLSLIFIYTAKQKFTVLQSNLPVSFFRQ